MVIGLPKIKFSKGVCQGCILGKHPDHEAKTLPPKFWAKAINCASYIQNRVPHNHLDGITPFESWSGHKPNVTHFRIFGSKAWARIPTENRKALQPQIQVCLFVGYFEYSKG